MQCYYRGPFRNIQFEKTSYQQFLRKQGLSEHAIRYLNIHFITDFTLSDFEGCIDLAEGGAFFKRGREYVEQENETTIGFYRPVDPPRKYAAIFLRICLLSMQHECAWLERLSLIHRAGVR